MHRVKKETFNFYNDKKYLNPLYVEFTLKTKDDKKTFKIFFSKIHQLAHLDCVLTINSKHINVKIDFMHDPIEPNSKIIQNL